jgi:predicted AlkP superfamily phosphohydrolase/phosphomutase
LIIGVDGHDPILLERWREELPYFQRMDQEGIFLKLRSVFPPDSVPAWTSIFTGLSPASHGLLHSIDYLGQGQKEAAVDFSPFQRKTFWDLAGQFGKRVCVINPFLAYPVWPVNGIMVSGPVFMGGPVQAFPDTVLREHDIPPLGGIVEFPTRKTLGEFCRTAREMTEALANFGVELFEKADWDLYFICFLTLDRIKHFLWRYCDREDPTCPEDDSYQDAILGFYRLFDDLLGRFWKRVGNEWIILVLSDHGHGRRSTKTLNLNEFLRKRGYLSSRAHGLRFLDHRYLLERLKTKTLQMMYQYDLGDTVAKMAKFIPRKKALKDSSFITDREGSLAYTPDFAGRNPFGGVTINPAEAAKRGLGYESFRDRLIGEISRIRDSQTGQRVVKWIRRREEVYNGQHLAKYPDIVFELEEDYGVSWTLYTSPVGINPTHKKISGGHRMDGVLMMANAGREVARRDPDLMDIAPTVLDLMGVPLADHFEGHSILR